MRFPAGLFGTSSRVHAETRKVVTLLRRGRALEEGLAQFPHLDLSDYPDALIVQKSGSWGGLGGEHFRPSTFSQAFFDFDRASSAELMRLRDESLALLAGTAWGTLVLNSNQQYLW